MRRILAVVVVFSGLALAIWLLWPRGPEDDEALIRGVIADVAAKASQKDIGGVGEHVSESYRGEGGSKQELKRYLLGYTMRSDWVAVLPAKVEVDLAPEAKSAKVSMVVLLARTPAEKAEDLRADEVAGSHRIDAELAKEDGDWRVTTARRRDAAVSDLF
ncbi:MAG TPA: hypothetical protein DFS52_06470 [Myxococcales bacterium]|jgi:hypothetical protein|nr:hypothetical protein [Myxococcales bacterium]